MLETALQEITVCYSNLPKRTIVLVLAYLTHSARLLAQSTLLVWLGEMRLSKICMNARTHRGVRVGGMDRFFPCRIVASVVFTGMRFHQRYKTYRWASFGISKVSLDSCCWTKWIKFSQVILSCHWCQVFTADTLPAREESCTGT